MKQLIKWKLYNWWIYWWWGIKAFYRSKKNRTSVGFEVHMLVMERGQRLTGKHMREYFEDED